MPASSWQARHAPLSLLESPPPKICLLDGVGWLSVLENIKLHLFKKSFTTQNFIDQNSVQGRNDHWSTVFKVECLIVKA